MNDCRCGRCLGLSQEEESPDCPGSGYSPAMAKPDKHRGPTFEYVTHNGRKYYPCTVCGRHYTVTQFFAIRKHRR
jgi:hypothetical protein